MQLNILLQNVMERIVLTFCIKMDDFLLIFATCDMEDEFLLGELVRGVEWTGGESLGLHM